MKRRILIVLVILVGLVVVGGLLWWLVVPSSVTVGEAHERNIVETLVATGQVTPVEQSTLISDVAAAVESVEVEVGEDVEAGAILVEFDDTTAQLDVEQAQAGVAEARAGLESIVEAGAPAALEDLQQASRDLEAARDDFDRARQLFDEGIVARMEVDEARRAVERAESRLAQARTTYREASEDGSDYDQAAAALSGAEVQHQQARRRLEDFTLRAPSEATVLSREIDPGDTVQPGTPVMTLAGDGPVDIVINPDERELATLQTGQPAVAATDAFPDDHFSATVRRIDPTVDAERGTITAHLRIDDPPDYLRTAMTATVDIELDRRPDALVVPRVAVRDLRTDAPWVIEIDGRHAVRTDIRPGLEDEHFVEVVDGLDTADIVVTDPDVEPGDRIRTGPEYEPDDEPPNAVDPAPDAPADDDPVTWLSNEARDISPGETLADPREVVEKTEAGGPL